MYLSTTNNYKLDEIVKNFEVGFRSYVVEIIKIKFPTPQKFEAALNEINGKIKPSSLINSSLYTSKISKIKKDYLVYYQEIDDSYQSFIKRDYDNAKVPYLSSINDYVEIFFDPYFLKSDLLKGFSTIEYPNISSKYKQIRNDLSHPGSSKITVLGAKEIFMFINRILMNLDEKYFWYVSKNDIKSKIDELVKSVNDNPIKINNIDEIKISYNKKIIGRDKELQQLNDFLFGSPYRNAGSVVVYGYGGLGKTALVVEFIEILIKESIDNSNKHKLDFVLFFTSKEEILEFSQTTGSLIINPLKKQISSFTEFKEKLFNILSISTIDELNKLKGIVVIDNFETINSESGDDKANILHLIFNSPRSIQFILTSREEEQCEQKIHLKGFDINNNGVEFVENYIIENELTVDLKSRAVDLVNSSKGNTLILVLALLRLQEKINTIEEIISELDSTSSSNMEMMSLFMYKNTFDRVISELNNPNSLKILTIISLYGEPIDLFSISKLSGINSITEVENICNILASKLVLTKNEEQFVINEFANKFIFIKLRQNLTEEKALMTRISDYKFNRRSKLRKLDEKMRKHPSLNGIMNDWQARTIPDKLAIVESFDLYSAAQKASRYLSDEKNRQIVEEVELRFSENERMSSHPYIKFQKARIFQLFLQKEIRCITLPRYLIVISNCFEEVILSINVDYKFMKNTKSYASVLWFYGQFLNQHFDDFNTALRYFEEAKHIFESLKQTHTEEYVKILYSLANTYKSIYDKTNNSAFIVLFRQTNDLIKSLRVKVPSC